jgi:hypothetical protein
MHNLLTFVRNQCTRPHIYVGHYLDNLAGSQCGKQQMYRKRGKCSVDFLNQETSERYIQRKLDPYVKEFRVREKRRMGEIMEMKHSHTQ